MENIIKTLKLSEAVLKGIVTFPELDTTQKNLIGHTLERLRESIDELSNSHKHSVSVKRPDSALLIERGNEYVKKLRETYSVEETIHAFDDFTAGWMYGISQAAGVCGAVDKTT